jgi:hypothetical protein
MAHAQKTDFLFRRNGRVHLNRRGRQFSRLLAAKVCASALVMLDTPRSEVMWEYWLPTSYVSFLFTSPPVRHRVPSGFKRTRPKNFMKYTICHTFQIRRRSETSEIATDKFKRKSSNKHSAQQYLPYNKNHNYHSINPANINKQKGGFKDRKQNL